MKRKYDLRNKRNFIIILVLSILIIIIFSLFIYKYTHTSKIMYTIDTGSVVQDVNKNYINIEEEATLKVRWNDSYYLNYQDKKINLGKKVIVYNTIDNSIKLYGRFYEILEDGKIVENVNETVLANTTDTKFYKMDDREYLLVDRKIVSDDRSIEADNYMLVELDKMGNAKLSNNKLNLKTITPTKLVTSKYVFDIANENLKYNKLDIDLKKIIGSSNQYKEEEKKDTKGGSSTNTTNTTNNGFGGNNTVQNNNMVVNGTDTKGEMTTLDELKDKVKMTSIIRTSVGLSQIDVDYVIYDPYGEYKTVYVEVVKSGKVDVLYLSKTDTHIIIDNLVPGNDYKLNFIYTVADKDTGEIKPTKFEEMTVKTNKPVYKGYVTGIYSYTTHKLTYAIDLQEGYNISSVDATIEFRHQITNSNGEIVTDTERKHVTLPVLAGQKKVTGSIDITGYNIVDKEKAMVYVNGITDNNGNEIRLSNEGIR